MRTVVEPLFASISHLKVYACRCWPKLMPFVPIDDRFDAETLRAAFAEIFTVITLIYYFVNSFLFFVFRNEFLYVGGVCASVCVFCAFMLLFHIGFARSSWHLLIACYNCTDRNHVFLLLLSQCSRMVRGLSSSSVQYARLVNQIKVVEKVFPDTYIHINSAFAYAHSHAYTHSRRRHTYHTHTRVHTYLDQVALCKFESLNIHSTVIYTPIQITRTRAHKNAQHINHIY